MTYKKGDSMTYSPNLDNCFSEMKTINNYARLAGMKMVAFGQLEHVSPYLKGPI